MGIGRTLKWGRQFVPRDATLEPRQIDQMLNICRLKHILGLRLLVHFLYRILKPQLPYIWSVRHLRNGLPKIYKNERLRKLGHIISIQFIYFLKVFLGLRLNHEIDLLTKKTQIRHLCFFEWGRQFFTKKL